MGPQVSSAGWSVWPGNSNHLTAYFAEYNSMDLSGNPINVSQRVSWSHQLTAAEVDAYSKANWLGGADGWNPVIITLSKLTGDYNNDGIVDASDYTVWRDSLNSDSTLLNETASIGSIDDDDYDAWKANYGTSTAPGSGGSSPVPEPAAVITILSGILSLAAGRRITLERKKDGTVFSE
jgi:Pectinesterase